MFGTKSYQNFVIESQRSGYDVDDDIIELVEVDKLFVILCHTNCDEFAVCTFIKGTNEKAGDYSGVPIIETDDYDAAFDKFLSTIKELK